MSSALRPFSLAERVTADDARFDRLAMEIGDWFIQGTPETVSNFFTYLGPHPAKSEAIARIRRKLGRPLEMRQFGWMFNSPEGRGHQVTGLDLKSNRRHGKLLPNRPLAAGRLKVDDFTNWKEYQGQVVKRLRFLLTVNLTRYVRHQSWPRFLGESHREWDLGVANLRTRDAFRLAPHAWGFDEVPLDSKDNVLIGSRALSFGRGRALPLHFRRYLGAFERAAGAEFLRAYREAGLRHPDGVRRLPADVFYNLKEAEAYFEFSAENPTKEVRLLEPFLMARGVRATSREYPHGFAERGIEENSRSVLIVLPGGRQLRVYAKTTARIRCEWIYDFNEPARCAILHPESDELRKTTREAAELFQWQSRISGDAAAELNRVFALLETDMQSVELAATTYELIGRIFAVVRDNTRAESLLRLLVENGSLRLGDDVRPFLPEIQKLRRAGVIQHESGTEQIAPFYREALRLLQVQAGVLPAEESAD